MRITVSLALASLIALASFGPPVRAPASAPISEWWVGR